MTKLITIFDKDLNQRVFRLFYENEIEHKIDTILSISSSSSSIDVGDSVVISGVLTDENSTPLGGMSVKILRNNSVIDTVTTNSSGVYTKTVSGLNIGTYHFHAVYDGNDTYDNAISSTIDVSVVGHTYVVTITSDKQTALVGDNVTISGTLTRDGVGYGGQSVRIFDDGVLLDTVTTDNNGDYTKTISNLTLGTHRYSSQFDAVESNIAIVEVNNHLYDIDITADNPIIESGDTATITATLTDNTVPVVGETLSYTVSHDSTTIDSGTLTTGSNGSASFSYNGTGVGDVTIEIDYSTLLQETYEVEDNFFFDSGEVDNTALYDNTTYNQYPMNFTHDSTNNCYNLVRTSNNHSSILVKNLTVPKYVKLEFDIKIGQITNTQPSLCLFNNNVGVGTILVGYSGWKGVNICKIEGYNQINENLIDSREISISANEWYHIEFIVEDNVFTSKLYKNNQLLLTNTGTNSTIGLTNSNTVVIGFGHNNGSSCSFKNLKVKAL